MGIKLMLWYLLHDRKKFRSDILKKLHLLTLESSEYYPECETFYSQLDVRNKVVMDVGCDFGTTPVYFLRKGASAVIGFSKDKQYFRKPHYEHHDLTAEPEALSRAIEKILDSKRESRDPMVLKSDCEGCEWDFTEKFVDRFDDWIIAVHTPVRNQNLLDHVKKSGKLIGSQKGCEFGIYKKL